MINTSLDKTLKILLPNTNRALAEALQSASPEQLKELGKHTSVKAVLESLFVEKIATSKSDSMILDILKNSPIFKDMGSFSKDILTLQNLLKEQSFTLPNKQQLALIQFIKTVESTDPKTVKKQFHNSGIFLESKLLTPTNFKEILQDIAKDMKKLVQKSPTENAREIEKLLEPLIQKSLNLQNDEKALLEQVKKLSNTIEQVQDRVKTGDTKEIIEIVKKIKNLIKPEIIEEKPVTQMQMKELTKELENLYSKVEESKLPQKMQLLDSIGKVILALRTTQIAKTKTDDVLLQQESEKPTQEISKQTPPPIEKRIDLEQKVQKIIQPLIEQPQLQKSKELEPIIEKIKNLIKPTVVEEKPVLQTQIKPIEIKELAKEIETLYNKVEQTNIPQKMQLLATIEKVIIALKDTPSLPQAEQKNDTPMQQESEKPTQEISKQTPPPIEKRIDLEQKVQKIIQSLIEQPQLQKSKELEPIIEKIKNLIKPTVVEEKPVLQTQIKPIEIKELAKEIETLYNKVEQTNIPQKMQLLATIEKVIIALKDTPSLPQAEQKNDTPMQQESEKPTQEISKQTPPPIEKRIDLEQKVQKIIQSLIEQPQLQKSKELEPIIEKIKNLIKPTVIEEKPVIQTQIKPIEIKELTKEIENLYTKLEQSKVPQKIELLEITRTILSIIKPIVENQIQKEHFSNLLRDIEKITTTVESSTIAVDDPIISDEFTLLNERVKLFTKPNVSTADVEMNERIIHDMKANLLELSEEIKQNPQLQNSDIEKLVDKLTLQIDYFQLYSHLNNSSSLYFPFVWDQLDNGSVSIKKGKKDKFYCEINLSLKDHGELRLMLSLYNKNQINLHTYSQSEGLKVAMRQHLELLRSNFHEANLMLKEVRFFDIEKLKTEGYETPMDDLHSGFEVKI